jgi:hypothetical protein
MTQALYAHMNNKTMKKKRKESFIVVHRVSCLSRGHLDPQLWA